MQQKNIVLVRHGLTEWAATGQHTGRTDIPLTETGGSQAIELKPILAALNITKAYTSPLSRAAETARLAGLPEAITCDDLLEYDYGEYEGMTTADIQKKTARWSIWTHPCPGGETIAQVVARTKRALEVAKEGDGNVALVSHGHFLRILACSWLGLPPESGKIFMLDTASVSILSYEHDQPAIKIWNITANNRNIR